MGHCDGRHYPRQLVAPAMRGNQHAQVPGRGYHLVAPAKAERGRGDVLQTALAGLLLPGQGRQRGQTAVADRQLLNPGALMRRKNAVLVEMEERSRPDDIEELQQLPRTQPRASRNRFTTSPALTARTPTAATV
ncbi:hypothetical protein OG609_43535 [Streptomyces sp. NBC_01224]|uniref:hypothetical protein n=1 Tax=Streptomyces sp. NBC_01224 TaxID=2903783 RepID=UPI002E1162DF|nr:hypothetical protein OG609_43535 [Streptomyces sp. NBC_01224]